MAERGDARMANSKTAGKVAKKGKDGGEQADALYTSDVFRMYCYKVLPCTKAYNHNWKVCPFAHEGEKARRRDPRAVRYVGIECPDGKSGKHCPRGVTCPFAHNVFEYWLHPTRYRTQLCNEPATCRRKVCFFAHTLEELREPSLEEFAMIPAALPANGRGTRKQHNRTGGPPPRALEAAAKVQESLALRQAELRRLEINQRQHVHAQSPVYDQMFDQNQGNFPFGCPSPINGTVNPSPLDDALRELAGWISQQNTNTTPSPTGSSHSGESEQTVRLLMLLQELIHTQQGGKDTPGGRSSPPDPPSTADVLPSHRFSLDGATSCLHGQLSFGGTGLMQNQFVPVSPVMPGAGRGVGNQIPVSSESLGMAWGMGSNDRRKRLSMDAQCQGRCY